MRIALTSDIHADFVRDGRRALLLEALADEIRAAEADVLCIAGDVCNHANDLADILRPLAVARLNLYVPGNHDVWRKPSELARQRNSEGALHLLKAAAEKAGFVYLPGNPQTFDGWGFAGSLGWYDYTFNRPDLGAPMAAYRAKSWRGIGNNDGEYAWWPRIDGSRAGDDEMTDRFLAELAQDLATLGCNEEGGPPTVAMTHVLPYRQLVEYRGNPEWDFFSAFMGSERFGALYDTLPSVRAAFAGHTHVPRGFVRPDGFMAAVSPVGYYGSLEFPHDLSERVAVFETQGNSLIRIAP